MRILYLIVMSLLSMAIIVGTALVLAAYPPASGETSWSWLLGTIGGVMLVVPAVLIGAFLQWWPGDPRRGEGARHFRRLLIVSVVVQLAGVGAVVAFAMLVGAPAWIPGAAAASGALITVVSYLLGDAIRRRYHPSGPSGVTDVMGFRTNAQRRRVNRIAIVIGSIAFALSTTGTLLLVRALGGEIRWTSIASALSLGVAMAAISAGAVELRHSWLLAKAVRDSLGDSYLSQRRIGKVVMKGARDIELNVEESRRAAEYSVLMLEYLPAQYRWNILLLIGIAATNAPQLLRTTELAGLTLCVIAFLVVAAIVMIPLSARQFRRVRTYARTHRHLLEANVERSRATSA